MDTLHLESIGLLAGAIGLIAWVPQLQTVWIKRLHQGVDLRTLTIILAALCTWCVYGYLTQAWAVCISNTCSSTLILAIMWRVRQLRKLDQESRD